MTDRELLELAAKAAGVCLHPEDKIHHSYGNWGCDRTCTVCGQDPSYAQWNPLADDGDALRLAVKLRIQVTPGTYNKDEFSAYNSERHAEAHERYASGVQGECAATRRAIVRAAAETGKAM